MNKIFLTGNLGADADVKVFGDGNTVVNFSLATTEKWKDKDGNQKEKTEWHRCKRFGKGGAKLATYLLKGTKLAVVGSVQYGSYEKEGVKMYSTDIRVDNLEFLSKSTKSDADDSDLPPDTGSDDVPY